MNKISVFATNKKFNFDKKNVSAIARRVFLLLKKDGYKVDFYLVGDNFIKKINRIYRKKNATTNVLSFCEPKDFVGAPSRFKYLGEIYINPDFIYKNHQDEKLMVVHGILHLFGYDHEYLKERLKMEKKEMALIKKI